MEPLEIVKSADVEAPRRAAPVVTPFRFARRGERLLQTSIVPGSFVLACLAAWAQQRLVLGAESMPLAAFILPGALGILAGMVIAWLLVARRSAEARASVDQLTKIKNRAALQAVLDNETERSERYGTPFGVVVFDVDHFKAVNDTHGHAAGDVVLLHLAEVVNQVIRRTDAFGRWGGDEFVIVAPGTGASGCRALAEKVREAVERQPAPGNLAVTISVGCSGYVAGDSAGSVLQRADEALYDAKRGGRNRSAATRCLRSTGSHPEL